MDQSCACCHLDSFCNSARLANLWVIEKTQVSFQNIKAYTSLAKPLLGTWTDKSINLPFENKIYLISVDIA